MRGADPWASGHTSPWYRADGSPQPPQGATSARLLELLTEHAHHSSPYTQFISHPCPYLCSGGACRAGPPGGSATADQLW